MNKTRLVIFHEIITTISRKSFIFTALGIPLLTFVIYSGVSAINQSSPDRLSQIFSGPQSIQSEGFVDHSEIIRSMPDDVPADALIAFPDEAAAREALNTDQITAYYVIPSDYLATGEIEYYRPDFNPLSASGQFYLMQWVLRVNLLQGDMALAARIVQPFEVRKAPLVPELARDEDNPLTYWVPYSVTMVYYIVILMSASFLLNSVTKEKENQVIEVLMTSMNPRDMLTGKIIGLGVVGLIQTALWVGTGYSLLRLSGRSVDVPFHFTLEPSFLVWGLIFFVLGYGVYASLMAALGALVPNLREASQATIVIIMPLIVPMFLLNILIELPHGAISTVMSIFPLTAPVVMMTRLSVGGVPFWHPILSVGLLGITVILIVRMAGRLFIAQTLLSGQSFNLKRFLFALIGRP